MARTKQLKRNVSPELGDGDWAVNFNANGRAIRKCRTRQRDSPFEDSAIAISDESEDDVDENDGEVIPVAQSRKRKRSPTPEDTWPPDHFEALSETDSDSSEHEASDSLVAALSGHTTVHLTVNIPVGHQGPITLHLDPKTITSQPTQYSRPPDRLTQSTLARLNARSKSKSSRYAGFLDLPAELRNEIYRTIFTSERSVNFGCPDNFSRSAQLLRSCNQVHEEGRWWLHRVPKISS